MKRECILVFSGLLLAVAFAAAVPEAGSAQQPTAAPAVAEAPAAGPLLNPKQPFEGVLTGGFAGPEGYAVLATEGYKTYVDLRPEAERTADADAPIPAGLRIERVPVAGEADLNLATVRALDKLLDDRTLYPVVVACGSGNRVGALLALRAFWLDGVPAQEALDLGRKGGLTRLEPTVRMLLGLPPAEAAQP